VISATLTLALGLGANIALFSLLDRLYLQGPAGIAKPSELKRLYRVSTYGESKASSYPVFMPPEWRAMAEEMPSGVAAAALIVIPNTPLDRGDDAPRGIVTQVAGDYFGTLGVHMLAGRVFSPDEVRLPGFAPVAVVTSALALERFGDVRAAIGKPLDLGLKRYTIVGVAPPGFRGTELDAADVWVPMNTHGSWVTHDSAWLNDQHNGMIHVFVRLPAAAAVPAVVASARRAVRRVVLGDTAHISVAVGSINEMMAPGINVNEAAIASRLAVVAFTILLIVCANVANLLLARALARRREIGVRLALGVSRARLVMQLLTESVVLATIGTTAALVMAVWTSTALRHALLPNVQWATPAIGWRTIIFAAAAAIIAGFATGLVPALQASRLDLSRMLSGGVRDGAPHRSAIRGTLLAAQIALSFVLLAGAGLFVRSLKQVEAVDTGYDSDRLIFADVSARADTGHAAQDAELLLHNAAARIAQVPGVDKVSFTMYTPMSGFSMMTMHRASGDTLPQLGGWAPVVSFVSPEYFSAMGMHILEGRGFSDRDRLGAEPVIVVNANFARTVWPGIAAVGQCVVLGKTGEPCRRVVGVVTNAHSTGVIEPPRMLYYVPLAQGGFSGKPSLAGSMQIHTTTGHAPSVAGTVAQLLRQMTPGGVRQSVRLMSEQVAPQMRPWRLGAALFTAAGLLALLVAGVGIYGTIAYSFSQRTQEIGVRIALGAQGSSIIALVLKSSLAISAIGVALGTLIAVWAGRFVQPLLYDTAPNNPFVLGGVALVLLGVAVVASLVPANRAKSVDPLEALRAE
jgi:predicted permease